MLLIKNHSQPFQQWTASYTVKPFNGLQIFCSSAQICCSFWVVDTTSPCFFTFLFCLEWAYHSLKIKPFTKGWYMWWWSVECLECWIIAPVWSHYEEECLIKGSVRAPLDMVEHWLSFDPSLAFESVINAEPRPLQSTHTRPPKLIAYVCGESSAAPPTPWMKPWTFLRNICQQTNKEINQKSTWTINSTD